MKDIIFEIKELIKAMKEEQAPYEYAAEDTEIRLLESRIQTLVDKRNNKMQIFNGYQKDIDKLEETLQTIDKLINPPKEEEEVEETLSELQEEDVAPEVQE